MRSDKQTEAVLLSVQYENQREPLKQSAWRIVCTAAALWSVPHLPRPHRGQEPALQQHPDVCRDNQQQSRYTSHGIHSFWRLQIHYCQALLTSQSFEPHGPHQQVLWLTWWWTLHVNTCGSFMGRRYFVQLHNFLFKQWSLLMIIN